MEQNAHAKISDLALLALLASNELQELDKRGDTDCFYVTQLFNHLSAEIPDLTAAGVKRLAPSTMRVYERAIHEATNSPSDDLATLSKMLADLLKDLKTASEARQGKSVDRAEMRRLLAFLNSLHAQLVTQKQRAMNKKLGSKFRV